MANKDNLECGELTCSPSRLVVSGAEDVSALLEREVVASGVAPGAVGGVARRGPDGWRGLCGYAGTLDSQPSRAVVPSTPFDLASLTKPLTALVAARLLDRGVWAKETTLEACVPYLSGTFAGKATLEALMSHRSGLVPHLPLFEPLTRGLEVNVTDALLACANGRGDQALLSPVPPVYSDLGYILLGVALERLWRPLSRPFAQFDALVARQLSSLGLSGFMSARQWQDTLGSGVFEESVAVTEDVPYRGGRVRGAVHDDNAWALAGSASCGHAGLFANVEAVLRLGTWVLDERAGRQGALSTNARELLFRPRPGGGHLAGFDTKSQGPETACGTRCGTGTFGHLGFTGTSLWCDPTTETVLVLLCHRVNPTRENTRIRACRPRVNDALHAMADRLYPEAPDPPADPYQAPEPLGRA